MRGDEEIQRYRDEVETTRAKQVACAAVIAGALALAQFGPEDSIDIEDEPPPLITGEEARTG